MSSTIQARLLKALVNIHNSSPTIIANSGSKRASVAISKLLSISLVYWSVDSHGAIQNTDGWIFQKSFD